MDGVCKDGFILLMKKTQTKGRRRAAVDVNTQHKIFSLLLYTVENGGISHLIVKLTSNNLISNI